MVVLEDIKALLDDQTNTLLNFIKDEIQGLRSELKHQPASIEKLKEINSTSAAVPTATTEREEIRMKQVLQQFDKKTSTLLEADLDVKNESALEVCLSESPMKCTDLQGLLKKITEIRREIRNDGPSGDDAAHQLIKRLIKGWEKKEDIHYFGAQVPERLRAYWPCPNRQDFLAVAVGIDERFEEVVRARFDQRFMHKVAGTWFFFLYEINEGKPKLIPRRRGKGGHGILVQREMRPRDPCVNELTGSLKDFVMQIKKYISPNINFEVDRPKLQLEVRHQVPQLLSPDGKSNPDLGTAKHIWTFSLLIDGEEKAKIACTNNLCTFLTIPAIPRGCTFTCIVTMPSGSSDVPQKELIAQIKRAAEEAIRSEASFKDARFDVEVTCRKEGRTVIEVRIREEQAHEVPESMNKEICSALKDKLEKLEGFTSQTYGICVSDFRKDESWNVAAKEALRHTIFKDQLSEKQTHSQCSEPTSCPEVSHNTCGALPDTDGRGDAAVSKEIRTPADIDEASVLPVEWFEGKKPLDRGNCKNVLLRTLDLVDKCKKSCLVIIGVAKFPNYIGSHEFGVTPVPMKRIMRPAAMNAWSKKALNAGEANTDADVVQLQRTSSNKSIESPFCSLTPKSNQTGTEGERDKDDASNEASKATPRKHPLKRQSTFSCKLDLPKWAAESHQSTEGDDSLSKYTVFDKLPESALSHWTLDGAVIVHPESGKITAVTAYIHTQRSVPNDKRGGARTQMATDVCFDSSCIAIQRKLKPESPNSDVKVGWTIINSTAYSSLRGDEQSPKYLHYDNNPNAKERVPELVIGNQSIDEAEFELPDETASPNQKAVAEQVAPMGTKAVS